MKPIKIKLSKRPSIDESESNIPFKKRLKYNVEKENQTSICSEKEINLNKPNKVLKNSPVPSSKSNSKICKKEKISSDDESSESLSETDEFEQMFLQLKKSGIKTVNSTSTKSPETLNRKVSLSSEKKNTEPSVIQPKSKKKLADEFENLKSPAKVSKRISCNEKKIPELEKLPEDLILNFKRTSIKKYKFYDSDSSPERNESFDRVIRRSSRGKSVISSKEANSKFQETPVKRPSRTPNKTPSSSRKKDIKEPRTPISKIEEPKATTPLEKARMKLHVSAIPDSLPCREKEYDNILMFLENKLWDGIGGCMYISGVPGTGKTATVTQVIRHLQNLSEKGKVPEFKYIEINGMRLAEPRQAYVQLWQKLFEKNEKITSDRAQRLLDEWFSKSNKKNSQKTTVLLVDELDLICTKKQDVVYNLLDWPTRTHSRLVVLTIANTMDMPERLFKGRVTSRMGLTRLTFMPYTHKQLEEIVLARLNGLNAFVTDAVRLVSRKVAAVSGDARRALDICRRATEIPSPDETVLICHIEQAVKEMTNSNIVKVIRNCGEMEKIFLRSLSDVCFRSNVEEVDLRDVIDQFLAICVLEGISRPSISTILSVTHRLKCCRLIFSNQSNAGILQSLTLNVTQDDIHYALRV